MADAAVATRHPDGQGARFRIFRASEATDANDEVIELVGLTEADEFGIASAADAGLAEGAVVKVLFTDEATGISLTYAWLKPNYVLPRHAHNADCTYLVISGEAHLGAAILAGGDGFFVPAEHYYQYAAGPDGAEVIEFRNAASFNMTFSGNGEQFWARAAGVAASNRELWRTGAPPLVAGRVVNAGAG